MSFNYGLVRQIGPWKTTPTDFIKINAPPPIPYIREQEFIRPYQQTDSGSSSLPVSSFGNHSVVMPTVDPRVHQPGRRIPMDMKLANMRVPLESGGALTSLAGSAGLSIKLDPTTGLPMDGQQPVVAKPKELPQEKVNMTPAEMGAAIGETTLNTVSGLLPFAPYLL